MCCDECMLVWDECEESAMNAYVMTVVNAYVMNVVNAYVKHECEKCDKCVC